MNNSINHKFHHISRAEYQELLAVSRGDAVADYIIDNVSILDLINGGEISGPIVIKGRYIAGVGAEYADAPALQRIDARGATAVPGFIDAHLHIESSMMTPVTFETATLPRGLTTVICDPHEIVNVMGEAGFAWFARCAEQARQNQYLQVSSCVPALEGCDVNGASFTLEQMLAWRDHPQVTGLAEMMDYPGVISGQNALLDKLDAFRHLTLDGHCPGLGGKELNAYIAAGIENCHESYQLEEGRRKLQLGMSLMIREGSAARNLNALAPGKQADIVLLSDARKVTVQQVLVKGEPIDAQTLQAEESARLAQSAPPYGNTIDRQPVSASDFALQFTPGKRYRVIEVIHNELITHSRSSVYSENGFDRDDVCFIAVLERYGQRLAPACGLLGGFGLNEGALAATVSHDSHNIVVIGRSAEEMALAVNQVIQDGGGLCVVRNGQVQSHLPLPIAGLMSTDTAQSLAEQIDALKAAARECGPLPDEPFIQMAFLSLPVIPALKLTSQGLFDGEKFAFTTLEVTE
ncbi:adenine deaminase C-terminal domain-containing protein [Escherichia coli]|uniref:adenine deaminase C-terminal domain-containing protein n=1 Tax=Escherichia coli TaxID=562 RepID=UPI00147EB8A5|nr:adenine deaminase C-terminal domain-containing protein [Escherichia coli]